MNNEQGRPEAALIKHTGKDTPPCGEHDGTVAGTKALATEIGYTEANRSVEENVRACSADLRQSIAARRDRAGRMRRDRKAPARASTCLFEAGLRARGYLRLNRYAIKRELAAVQAIGRACRIGGRYEARPGRAGARHSSSGRRGDDAGGSDNAGPDAEPASRAPSNARRADDAEERSAGGRPVLSETERNAR